MTDQDPGAYRGTMHTPRPQEITDAPGKVLTPTMALVEALDAVRQLNAGQWVTVAAFGLYNDTAQGAFWRIDYTTSLSDRSPAEAFGDTLQRIRSNDLERVVSAWLQADLQHPGGVPDDGVGQG